MTDNHGNKKKIFLNSHSGKTFAEASIDALEINQYDVAKNSNCNFREGVIYDVPIKDIDQDDLRFQMRSPKHDISELKKSIKELGQLTPVVLLYLKGRDKLIIISGFSRTQANDQLNMLKVKAVIKKSIDEIQGSMFGLVENVVRKTLTEWQLIHWVDKLVKSGVTINAVSESIGKDRSTVSGYQKVSHSKTIIAEALKGGLINFSQAYTLSVNEDRLTDTQLKELINSPNKLSVKKLENAIEELLISSEPVKESTKKQKSKPKLAVVAKENIGGQYFSFSKIGDTIHFNTKLIVSKENSGEVIAKLEQAISDIKGL